MPSLSLVGRCAPRARRAAIAAARGLGLAAVGLWLFDCGSEPTPPPAPPTLVGSFALQTANGQNIPIALGLGYRRGLSSGPADTVFYASDQYTFTEPAAQPGNLSRTRSWIYRYRPTRPDTTTMDAGPGVWSKEGAVYVLKYGGFADSATLELDGSAFTVRFPATGFLPAGLVLRYVRTNP